MSTLPSDVAEFLGSRRIAVSGVSRSGAAAANAVFRKLRHAGFDVFPINPHATELDGVRAYPTITAIGAPVDGVVVATHPDVAVDVVRDAAGAGARCVWFHRSFGQGSVSQAAVDECHARGLRCIVGGCPLMFCEPVDVAHRCMRWWLQRTGRVPR
jgi:predicted CoA-binding protein